MESKNKFTVIYFTHYAELYGANRSLMSLIDGLRKYDNIEVLLVTPREGPMSEQAREKGIKVKVIPFVNEVAIGGHNKRGGFAKKAMKLFYNWWIVIKYSRSIRGKGPLIIHTNSSATFIGAYFAFWLRLPHIWHVREFGWVDCKMTYDFGESYFKFWLNKAQAAIGISRSILETRILASNAKRKSLIYNGVALRPSLNDLVDGRERNGMIIFAIVGLLTDAKNQMDAIDAFTMLLKKRGNVKLLVVGSGEENYSIQLKKRVIENGIEEFVVFTGFVKEMTDIYRSIDFLLMCSKNEALGRVTIEAMSFGVPVVGFDNGGTSEIIKDGFNGLLYSGGHHELFEKMDYLMENIETVGVIKSNCIRTVKESFSVEQYAEKVENLYTECLNIG